jgi:acetamidase/formamidase
VFGFALNDASRLIGSITLGEVTVVEIADGMRRSRDTDWFTTRTPVMPAATGPLRIPGVCPGDILQVEVLDLETVAPVSKESIIVTIGLANGETLWSGPGLIQAAIPAGGVVRLPIRQTDGLVAFGPVLTLRRRDNDQIWEPARGWVTVRCSVMRGGGS